LIYNDCGVDIEQEQQQRTEGIISLTLTRPDSFMIYQVAN